MADINVIDVLLYGEPIGTLISGDHVLPTISPNISLWSEDSAADPLEGDAPGRIAHLEGAVDVEVQPSVHPQAVISRRARSSPAQSRSSYVYG